MKQMEPKQKDVYEPLCRECFNKALAEDAKAE